MQEQKPKRINRLIQEWPKGAVLVASFLNQKGLNSNLINWYKNSQWLETVGRGAYKLFGDEVEWYGGLYAIQKQLGLSVHAGGKTALTLMGYAHYLADSLREVYLYGQRGEKLPEWFHGYVWGVKVHYRATNLLPPAPDDGLSEYNFRDFSIDISSPERAALELLYHVPEQQGFGEALLIIENLATLRPEVVQKLLEQCNSIRVKRLFMFMVEKHNHPWVSELDPSKIDFGKGKRALVPNGVLDKKYQITVPREAGV